MNIVIIEDELLTADDLEDAILQADASVRIVAKLASVQEAVAYFRDHEEPDLIFSDIQLGDGLSFEIFQALNLRAPIIFCTAYDEYAIDAFDNNGIHYILKPFNGTAITRALDKYKMLQASFQQEDNPVDRLLRVFRQQDLARTSAVLVHHKDKIIPVKLEHIALFYIKNEVTHLYTFDQKTYTVNKTLDEIQQVAGNSFYRANRQYIVNRSAVQDAAQYLSRKVSLTLTVPFTDTITISKEKIPQFLAWLASGG